MTVWDNIWFNWFSQNIDSEVRGVDFPDFKEVEALPSDRNAHSFPPSLRKQVCQVRGKRTQEGPSW